MTESSLYEHLFPLTTVMRQRMVENFDGDALDTDRWSLVTNGTSSGAMDDVVDGGYKIQSGTTIGSFGILTFNDKRHYSETASIGITVCKIVNNTNVRMRSGLAERHTSALVHNSVMVLGFGSVTNFELETRTASSGASTDTGLAHDSNFHSHKMKAKSASAELTIDGILRATRTTLLPVAKMQPVHAISNSGGATNESGSIRYFEAYNT